MLDGWKEKYQQQVEQFHFRIPASFVFCMHLQPSAKPSHMNALGIGKAMVVYMCGGMAIAIAATASPPMTASSATGNLTEQTIFHSAPVRASTHSVTV